MPLDMRYGSIVEGRAAKETAEWRRRLGAIMEVEWLMAIWRPS